MARALAIVTGKGYDETCEGLLEAARGERASHKSHPHSGIYTGRTWFKRYMRGLGFIWTATMGIGTGCKVHMREEELPGKGGLLICLSQHYTAVIDGVVMDTYDPCRDGTRCVYGWWMLCGEGLAEKGEKKPR